MEAYGAMIGVRGRWSCAGPARWPSARCTATTLDFYGHLLPGLGREAAARLDALQT